jgi:monothiol glutaredoxin|tara:strand:- start:4773 stop:5075 length:303 start_codon:yes stop_codon:yes gene_type:complete
MKTIEQIKEMISESDAILFMKGTPHQPQCGFSARVIQILIEVGKPFSYVDVLADPGIRADLPKVSDWPTFPQLFIKGELVGGCDIITEMHESDELAPMFS